MMFENPLLRVIAAALAFVAAFYAWKLLTKKKDDMTNDKMIVLSPAAFKPALPPVVPVRARKQLAPSPVDTTNVPYGEWDTNRHSANFITNAGDFPVPADSDTIPNGLAWKTAQKIAPQMPDITFASAIISDPMVGSEYAFEGQFGSVLAA